MEEERERFYSRLATIGGLRPMPSIGEWILLRVDNPSEIARKLARRLEPGVVSVPRSVAGAIRVPVRDPKQNERIYLALRDICRKKARARFYQELRQSWAAGS